MKKGGVSSAEVARYSGVSRTTVSFVLNNTPGKVIPEETRARVMKAIEELNYVPDDNARRMAKTTHQTIGLIVSHSGSVYTDAYILRLLEGIGSVLNKQRRRLILLPVRQELNQYMDLVRGNDLDGVLITNLLQHNIDLHQIREIYDNNIPLVVIGEVPDPEICQIDIDNVTAAATATRHLTSLGHRRIAMIVHLPLKYLGGTSRIDGYRLALDEAHIPFEENLITVANFTEESGYEAMKVLLALTPRPTAVFAGNDVVAWGAMRAITEANLQIPEDISIIGFDDDYPSRFMNPPLSSITVPASSLGERAARMVIELQTNKVPENRKIQVPVFLTLRESTGKPAQVK